MVVVGCCCEGCFCVGAKIWRGSGEISFLTVHATHASGTCKSHVRRRNVRFSRARNTRHIQCAIKISIPNLQWLNLTNHSREHCSMLSHQPLCNVRTHALQSLSGDYHNLTCLQQPISLCFKCTQISLRLQLTSAHPASSPPGPNSSLAPPPPSSSPYQPFAP